MRCKNTIELRPTAVRPDWVSVPCGQCLNCRITKRDHVVARILLESLSNSFGQFWTLTFNDDGLAALEKKDGRHLKRRFIEALQLREQRAGTGMRIRSFGVMEYGSDFGRPHIHLCLWNHSQTYFPDTPHKAGLPRPLYHIGSWPYGHVDIQPLNPKSARYVAKYVTKFNGIDEDLPSTQVYYPQRPRLGLLGLYMLADSLSRTPMSKFMQDNIINIEERKWALPPSLAATWHDLCINLDIRHMTDQELRAARHQRDVDFNEMSYTKGMILRDKEKARERLFEWGQKLKEQKDARVLSRALQQAAALSRSRTIPPVNTTAT